MLKQGGLREPYHSRIETVAMVTAHAQEMGQRFLPQTRPFTEMNSLPFPSCSLEHLQIDQNEVIFFKVSSDYQELRVEELLLF